MEGFKAEELKVTVVGRDLIFEARHEEKEEQNPCNFSCRRIKRVIRLPETVDIESVSPSLTAEGVLEISAAQKAVTNGPHTIPIQLEDIAVVENQQ